MNNHMNYDQEKEDYKQQLLEGVMKTFQEKLEDAAITAISNIQTDYLPHVLGNTESNVSFRIDKIINNIVAGKFEKVDASNNLLNMFKVEDGYGFHTYVRFGNYSDIIKPIWEMFGKEVENARIKQLEQEVLDLKHTIEVYHRY